MNYYKRHIGDYAKKAGHLSVLEHGVYTLLLDAYYDREQAPTRAEAMRQARARTPEEVSAVEAVLADFFTEVNGRFVQSRAEEEFVKAEEVARRNAEKGKLGGRPRKPKGKLQESRQLSDQKPIESPEKPNPLIHQLTAEANQKQVRSPSATRLPADWTLTPVRSDYCRDKRPELDPVAVFEDFEDYWRAKPGKDGTKLDWDRTWQKWVRSQRAPPGARAGPSSGQPSKQLTGVAGFLGVNANDLEQQHPSGLVLDADRRGIGGPVPADPRRLPRE